MTCPCNSGNDYEACCQPIHDGSAPATTAEALMRARYSAFANTEIDFLVESVHPDHREDVDPDQLRDWSQRAEWLGLEIKRTEDGGPEDENGIVEFVAEYEDQGVHRRYHEVGRFLREDERWYFVDGDQVKPRPVKRETPKVGRNEPCPCGSGKKYKKCCARKG